MVGGIGGVDVTGNPFGTDSNDQMTSSILGDNWSSTSNLGGIFLTCERNLEKDGGCQYRLRNTSFFCLSFVIITLMTARLPCRFLFPLFS